MCSNSFSSSILVAFRPNYLQFADDTYEERMVGIVSNKNYLCDVSDQETYAGYAASVFVTYCAEMRFL